MLSNENDRVPEEPHPGYLLGIPSQSMLGPITSYREATLDQENPLKPLFLSTNPSKHRYLTNSRFSASPNDRVQTLFISLQNFALCAIADRL